MPQEPPTPWTKPWMPAVDLWKKIKDINNININNLSDSNAMKINI